MSDWQAKIRVHPRARQVRLRVTRRHGLELVVPPDFPEGRVPALLERHRDWIAAQFRRLAEAPAPTLPTALELPALGERWKLERTEVVGRPRLLAHGEGLRLEAGDDAQARALLGRWLLAHAGRHLPPWLARVSADTGLGYAGVTIRLQRARWGSCSASRRISLNARLLLLPSELVRHVLVHELAHTVHLDHSAAFWGVVAAHDPHWHEHRARLKRHPMPDWLG